MNDRSHPSLVILGHQSVDEQVAHHMEDLIELDAPLPAQVEHTCDIFGRRFAMTADRLDSVAEKLERMALDLRDKAARTRAASTDLPEHIRAWVQTERAYIKDAQFFDPITK